MKIKITNKLLLLVLLSPLNTEAFEPSEGQVNGPDFSSCRKSSDGDISTKTTSNKIYKWIDSDGKTHFTQTPPPNEIKAEQTSKKHNTTQYFKLIFGEGSKIPRYRRELETQVRGVFKIFTTLIPRSKLNKVNLKFFVFDKKEDFQDFNQMHGSSINERTTGIHFGSKNIVAVLESTENRALITAIHEATHVITRGNFGRLPKWLNEGLAEYMEPIRRHDQIIEVTKHNDWTKYLVKPYLSVDELINSNGGRWSSSESSKNYAYSWALVFFMLSDNTRKSILRNYLIATLDLPCGEAINSYTHIVSEYPGGSSQLEADFVEWMELGSFSSHYY